MVSMTGFRLRHFLLSLLCLCCLLPQAFGQAKPNIVLIMADDLGWSDVGYNGAEFYETPHIDRLAREGMIFNRFYQSAANCAPSRASLLSGMYTPRHGVYIPQGLARGDVDKMRYKVPTRGEGEDFHTFDVSINQLDPNTESLAELLKKAGYVSARLGKWHVGDDNQGFDLNSAEGTPGFITNKNGEEKRYYNDANVAERLTDLAVKFIEDHQNQPFFLYLSHWEVHTPITAQEDRVAYFEEKLQKFSGQNFNPTYAAEIEQVDQSVGRLMEKLETLRLRENTLFIFTSDNGGLSEVTSNAPLRKGKGTYYEGGIRVPFCVSWPGQITTGQKTDVPIIGVDIFPTMAEITGAKPAPLQPRDGVSILPLLEGEEMEERALFWHFPLYLTGGADKCLPVYGSDEIHWRAVPSSVIMKGDWKLIYYYEYDSFELFNLAEDVGEKQNLVGEQRYVSDALLAELREWVKAVHAPVPLIPNPKFAY